jgi:hypothetical protein
MDPDDEEVEMTEATRRRSYSQCRDATANLGRAKTDKGKRLQILLARGSFEMLPIGKENDMVTGSWWFVWGSLISALMPIPCLIDIYSEIFDTPEDTKLKAFDAASTWIFLILSGAFFTAGSYAFVRAFGDPHRPPLLGNYYHFQTDELLGAWLYLFAVVPGVPFSIVYLGYNMTKLTYWGGLFGSILVVAASYGFVRNSYPSDKYDSGAPQASKKLPLPVSQAETEENKKVTQLVLPVARAMLGEKSWVIKHVINDWLATCWFFFYASVLVSFGSWVLLLGAANDRQLYVFLFGLLDSIIFTVGSAYFVAGSYPPSHEHDDTDHDIVAAALPEGTNDLDFVEVKRLYDSPTKKGRSRRGKKTVSFNAQVAVRIIKSDVNKGVLNPLHEDEREETSETDDETQAL